MKTTTLLREIENYGIFSEMLKFEDMLVKTNPDSIDDDINYIAENFTDDKYDELANLCLINSLVRAENIQNIIQFTYRMCVQFPKFKSSLLYVIGCCDAIAPYSKFVRAMYHLGVFSFNELASEAVFLEGFHLMFAKELNREDIMPIISKLRENDWNLFDQIMEFGYEKGTIGYAIINDDIELFKEFSSKEDFDVNGSIEQPFLNTTRRSYLMTAIYFGAHKIISHLINLGSEFNHDCLSAAVSANNRELIDKYKDTENINYDTCTFNATWFRRDEIFDDIMKNYNGKPVSLYACIHMSAYKYIYFFTENGAEESVPGCEPALVEAAKNGELTVVQYLVDKKFNVNIKNEEGDSALHIAVKFHRFSIIKHLLENGADVNIINEEEEITPLDVARRYQFKEIENLLISHGGKSYEEISKEMK